MKVEISRCKGCLHSIVNLRWDDIPCKNCSRNDKPDSNSIDNYFKVEEIKKSCHTCKHKNNDCDSECINNNLSKWQPIESESLKIKQGSRQQGKSIEKAISATEDIKDCNTCDRVRPCGISAHCSENGYIDWIAQRQSNADCGQAVKPAGKFENIGRSLGEMVDGKREAYGSSSTVATTIMKLLYPNGITIEQMHDTLLVVRVLDKLCRIANKKDAFGENPWADICGYSMIGMDEVEKEIAK